MKKRIKEDQIIGSLREVKAGVTVKDLCRREGFPPASFYQRCAKFGGTGLPDAKQLTTLEAENGRLKKLVALLMLEKEATREPLRKKWRAHWLVASWRAGWASGVCQNADRSRSRR